MRAPIVTATLLISLFLTSAALADTPAAPPALAPSRGNNCAALFYPAHAIATNEQGPVTLSVAIDDVGNVTGATVTQSSGFADLDQAAVKCTAAWHFRPATQDGKPVASTKTYRIIWKLTGDQDYPCNGLPASDNPAFVGKSAYISYNVNPSGNVQDAFVIGSSNDGSFDALALQCIARVSYKPPPAVTRLWGGKFTGTPQGVAFSNGFGVGKTCDSSTFPADILAQPADHAAFISFDAVQNAPPSDLIFERSSGNKPFDDAALACVKTWRYTFSQSDMNISVDAKIVSHQGHIFVLAH